MAKKQRRYAPAELQKAMPGLKGQGVSLVLQTGQVFHLTLLALEEEELLASDGLHRLHRFPLPSIGEVIVEKQA